MMTTDDVTEAFPLRLRAARLYLDSIEGGPVSNGELGRRVGAMLGRAAIDNSAVARWGKKKDGRMVIPDTRTAIALALVCSGSTPGAVDPGWLLCGDATIAPAPPTWELVVQSIREHALALAAKPCDRATGGQLSHRELAEFVARMKIEPDQLGLPISRDVPRAGAVRPRRR